MKNNKKQYLVAIILGMVLLIIAIVATGYFLDVKKHSNVPPTESEETPEPKEFSGPKITLNVWINTSLSLPIPGFDADNYYSFSELTEDSKLTLTNRKPILLINKSHPVFSEKKWPEVLWTGHKSPYKLTVKEKKQVYEPGDWLQLTLKK